MKFQIEAKKLQFKLDIKNTVPTMIISDEKRLKQVLFNLLGNAVKFTYKGMVTLNVDYERLTNTLSASVVDTGLGIKQEDI